MKLEEYIKEIVDLSAWKGTPPVAGVRYNPLKISRSEFERLFPLPLSPAAYYNEGFKISGEKAGLGRHPLHMGGACYFQEPSAMSAVTALNVQNGDKVLDLCASPGSKATALAALNPDGVMVVNEIHAGRAKILLSNIERMGIANALVTNASSEALAEEFDGYFDKILVDSPCSGEGMFRKYPEILNDWTEELVDLCAGRSRTILERAAGMLRSGGRLVYSTCTFNLEENEKTILSFLERHPEFSVADCGLQNGEKGRLGLTKARRIFLSEEGEGHFVCALQKNGEACSVKINTFTSWEPPDEVRRLLSDCVKMPIGFYGSSRPLIFQQSGDNVYILPSDLPKPKKVRLLRAGVQAAFKKGKTYLPCHHLFTATPTDHFVNTITVDDDGALRFLSGQTLPSDGRGFTAVLWQNICLGFGKASAGVLKNHFPKGLRIK